MGRQWTAEQTTLAQREICQRLADGESLSEILRPGGKKTVRLPPRSLVYQWLEQDDDFARQYQIARKLQADALVDAMMGHADQMKNASSNFEVKSLEQKINVTKWLVERLNPERWGKITRISAESPISVVVNRWSA
ncbi:MAG: hypothetical protein H7839_19410 [Magnetococcus sp. YQC-5]